MKILVTGADGMVGSALCPVLRERGHDVVATDALPTSHETTKLDIRDPAAVMAVCEQVSPTLVIHLAAATDVDRCELEPDYAYVNNAVGTERMVQAARAVRARLLYMSTAGVFDGEKTTPYVESDAPNPVNVYGRSKLIGEYAVQQYTGHYQIVRASWMVGGFERDKKFVAKVLHLLEDRQELTVVTDKIGSLTFTTDLSRGIAALLETQETGIFHMANQGACSRYDVACEIVKSLGRNDVTVRPITSDAFPLPAPRAASEVLENRRLRALGMDTMPSWQQSLHAYVKRYMSAVSVAPRGRQ